MTRRERLRRCYSYEELDRPAVYSRTGFPTDDRTYDRLKAYLQLHTELKHSWSSSRIETEPQIDTRDEPLSEDFKRRIVTLRTPAGKLERSMLISLKGQPGLHETFFIKSPGDVEKYLSLPLPGSRGDITSFFVAEDMIGDRGIIDIHLGFNPAGHAAELCGSETFALMSITDRDLLHALCQRQMDILLRRVEFLVAHGIGPYFSILGQEYVVPPLHGRDDFYDFNVRYDKPIIDLIHDSGGRVHVHSHGSIQKVFDGFVDMGADVLHPCEPPPLGDITAAEVKERARGRLCMEGNIQINRMYEAAAEEIQDETEQLIRDAFDDGRGLIVCPSASPYIRGRGEDCFPQYKAMIDTVLKWGRRQRSASSSAAASVPSSRVSSDSEAAPVEPQRPSADPSSQTSRCKDSTPSPPNSKV